TPRGAPVAAARLGSQKRHTGSRAGGAAGSGVATSRSIERTSRTNSPRLAAVLGSTVAASRSAASSSAGNTAGAARRAWGSGCVMLPPMPPRPRVHQLPVPNLTDMDFGKLRAGRLARLQAMLKRHDFPVALLYNTANIRYATGVDVMSVWTAG